MFNKTDFALSQKSAAKKLATLLIAFLILPAILRAQPKELINKILWDENRPLTWNDFKGPVDKKSSFKAETASGIYFAAKQESDDEMIVNVESYFDPRKSWRAKKELTDNLLKHEQNHFDIFEVYSRILIRRLSGLGLVSVKMISKVLSQQYSAVMKEAGEISRQYDKEANHSMNKEQQDLWNDKVKKLLAETKDYDLKSVTIKLIH
jgi:hypothetical protein